MSILFQRCLPQHLLSRVVGKFTQSRVPFIKNTLIDWFISRYHVDMSSALQAEPHSYDSFNDFFTRALKGEARPIAPGVSELACPADGIISQIGSIENKRIFQAKGFDFTVEELLGGNAEKAALFQNGQFITIYLSPSDYHRVHMPLDGELTEMVYIPGKLFSVNPETTQKVPRLFARNERVVAFFTTKAGTVALVLVGAMIVASINTVWHGEVTPPKKHTITHWYYQQQQIALKKGEEMGCFKLGSTAILLFEPSCIEWDKQLQSGISIKVGEVLGKIY